MLAPEIETLMRELGFEPVRGVFESETVGAIRLGV